MAPRSLLLLLVVFHVPILLLAADDRAYHERCPTSFSCGKLGKEIHFPFANSANSGCGFPIIGCDGSEPDGVLKVKLGGEILYEIESIVQIGEQNSFSVQDPDFQQLLLSHNCSALNYSVPLLPVSPMMSFRMNNIATLLICGNTTFNAPNHVKCNNDNHENDLFFGIPQDVESTSSFTRSGCSTIQLPIRSPPNSSDPFAFLTAEYNITVTLRADCHNCYHERGGLCRLASLEAGILYCRRGTKENTRKRVLIIATVASVVGVVVLTVLACCYRRKVSSRKNFTRQTIEAFLRYQLNLSTRRYSYSEIKKVTNSFKDKLGKGGYGTVYKGKLPDGRLVAVKVLSESKGNGEEFINEVASISNTSHVNIVCLLGFCFEGSKRALLYEFMPNGSLEKFIYDWDASLVDHQLDCNKLYNIAIGVARGLEYLHRGCNTKILHFDIKPHNILLDKNFCPKISGFGLAKICPQKESIVSLLGTRGTIGYIAPEVIYRNFDGVSHKSDVYSYGMMVLEMIGGRKNINTQVERVSEIYFPHWIYKRLELEEDFELRCIKNEDDKEIVKKMAVVSLWCIHTDPVTRPTMSKVVEMLEGALESLQLPPKPYLTSPSTSPAHCST